MIIRPFMASDRDAVIALWQECGLVTPANDPGRDIDRKVAEQPELLLVGESDGRIVATVMAGYDGHRGWLNYLATSPQYQLQGWGREMMRSAERLLSARGCPKINLQIRGENAAVREFYEAQGYVVEERLSLGKRLEV